jgi:CBS domain-containing membrane protein
MKSITIGDIMTREVMALEIDHSVNLAGAVMNYRHIRHLPVVEDGKLVGLVTHRDIARAQAQLLATPAQEILQDDAEALSVPVLHIMHRDVWRVTADTPVLEATRIMLDHKFGCLPVVDGDDHLVGIVTEVDLLRLLVSDLRARRALESAAV